MRPIGCFVIVALITSGCKHDHATQPPTTVSMVPQWPMFHHDARHTGNVNTPVFDVAGPQRDTVAILWRIAVDYTVFSSAAIGIDGTIYFGTQNRIPSDTSSFYAINPDGTVKWRYSPIGAILSSPAIGDDGTVFVGAYGGFYAFTPAGQLKWKISEPGEIISSPAIGKDGTIYYVTGYVTNEYLKAVDPSSSSVKWQVKCTDLQTSPSIGADGTIYFNNGGTITAITPTGQVKWQYNDSSHTKMAVWSIEVGFDGSLYFASSQSPYLYALDNYGHLKWKYNKQGATADPCIDLNDNVYALGGNFTLLRFASNGQIQSEIPLGVSGQLNAALTIDKCGVIFIAVSDDSRGVSLAAYKNTTLLWQFGMNYPDNGSTVVAAPALSNGALYFAWLYGPPYFYSLH